MKNLSLSGIKMANPKSKTPIIRPRSEDALWRRSKNNDNDIIVTRPRAKSGNNEKKFGNKGETSVFDNPKLGNITQPQNVRKGVYIGTRKPGEISKNVDSGTKGTSKRESFVIRTDNVGDKDVLVSEKLEYGWTESSEHGRERADGLYNGYTDSTLNELTASDASDFSEKLGSNTNEYDYRNKESEPGDIPNIISGGSYAKGGGQISKQNDTTASNLKEKETFTDDKILNNSTIKNNVLNVQKLNQNKSNLLKRTNDTVLHTDRSNNSRPWTPSSSNTQARYLGSVKSDNVKHVENQTQSCVNKTPEKEHSDTGREYAQNRVLSEITFIKDNSNGTFERAKSTESNFSHFSKGKRGNTFRVSSSSLRHRRSKSLGSASEKLAERFEEVKAECINDMSENIKDNNEVNDNNETFQTKITKLSKRRIPVRKKLPLDHTNTSVVPSASSSKTTEKNRVLETLNNSRNAFDSNSSSRLNSAEFINQDLKLVKRKVIKNNVMTEFNKGHGQITLKKNLLSNVNNSKGKQLKNPVNELFLGSKKHSAVVVVDRVSPYSQESDTVESYSNRGSKLHSRAPRAKAKQFGKNKHRVPVKNVYTQTTWFLQPKIHRYKADTQKRKGKTLIYQSSHKSVQTWLMNSSVKSNATSNIDRYADENLPNKKWKNLQLKLKKAPQSKTKKRRNSTFSNDVKKGEYLPLRRFSKQSDKKVDQKSEKHVDQLPGYESEIPVLYNSDEDDVYPAQRPLTDTERARYPNHRRYEGENDNFRANYRDAAHKKLGKTTGALVRFFRNGDPEYNGLPVVVNNAYRNFETLLVDLNGKIPTPTGVKYIFKWPEGNEITSVKEFQNRCVYVCSSTRQLKRNVNYGESREKYWVNKKPSAGKMRKTEKQLYKRPVSPKGSPTSNSPLIVTIINNISRDKREKVILNPQTQQTFEEWKNDINCSEIPVKTLHSEKHPYTEITSFSALFRELRINRNFIAVGDEGQPLEIMKKRQAPSSNSSSDSAKDVRSRRKKQNRKREEMDQIYEQGRPDSPTSGVMSRYDMGPRTMYGQRGRPIDNRRNLKDCVEIEIDGQIKEFIQPSYLDPQDDGAKPDKNLKCEWIYGFRGKDARHNLTILPRTGELVYYVAAVVILYDKERDTQRHYMKHNEEITCMSIHPNQYLIATGQLHGKEPEHSSHVRIWHGVSLSTYSVIGVGVFSGGIISIGFSNDGAGNLMCALDGSDKHVLSVWEWQTERVLARTMTSTDAVHACCFYPDDSNNSILITYGAKHIYFWKIFYDAARKREAKILRDRNSGIFEDEIPKSINCIAFLPSGHVVTGDTSGNLMLWTKDPTDAFVCSIVIQAHNCPISSLCMLEDGTLLSGAGNEIKAWDTNSNFRAVKARQIPQEAGNVRSIVTQSVGGIDGKLYIGTTKGCILDGSLQLKFRYTVQGHCEGVSGVCPHPFEPTFVTAGQDQLVIKWSLVTHKVIWKSHIEAMSTCLAVDHRHELVAIGTNEGSFITLNAYNGMHIATVQVDQESKGRIGCLAFSPDGMLLAVGCEDGLINIYAIHDRGQRYQKYNMPMKGHNACVKQLDWSTDGRCIESVGEDMELIFWDVDSMQQIKIPRMMRDVDWFTDTCTVAFGNIGPWTNLEKGELIKVVSRSNYRDFLIAGDTKGRLRLYKCPCSKEKSEYRQMRLYSSEVSGVAFTPDNRSVLSCGGNDGLALVQWNLSDEQ